MTTHKNKRIKITCESKYSCETFDRDKTIYDDYFSKTMKMKKKFRQKNSIKLINLLTYLSNIDHE